MTTWTTFLQAVRENDLVASTRLARALDVPDATFQTWRRRHAARALHRGVWTPEPRPSAMTWLRAALDVSTGSMLGGRSALWALRGADAQRTPRPLEVVTSHAASHQRVGPVQVRRSRTLLPEDRRLAGRWPTTTTERTALDLAATLQDDPLRALVIDLVFHGHTTPTALVGRAADTPTAWGAGRLRRVSEPLTAARVDSIFEWLVRKRLVEAGIELLPGPRTLCTRSGQYELDIVPTGSKVAIECDGGTHRTPEQQARDARKGNALALDGWILLRTTWIEFQQAPHELVAQVDHAVSQARLGGVAVQNRRS